MSNHLHPDEKKLYEEAGRSLRQSCTHCHYMDIQTGPSSAPFKSENAKALASLFCRFNPRIAVPTREGLLGVHPPVRPDDWCGQFREQTSKMISGAGR